MLIWLFLSLLYLDSFSNALVISVPPGPLLRDQTIPVTWSANANDPLSFTLALICEGQITLNDAVQRSSASETTGQVAYLLYCLGDHFVEAVTDSDSSPFAQSAHFPVFVTMPSTSTSPLTSSTTTAQQPPPQPPSSTSKSQIQKPSASLSSSTEASHPNTGPSSTSGSSLATSPSPSAPNSPSPAATSLLDQSNSVGATALPAAASPTTLTDDSTKGASGSRRNLAVVTVSSVLGAVVLLVILGVILWRVRQKRRTKGDAEFVSGGAQGLKYAGSGTVAPFYDERSSQPPLTPQRLGVRNPNLQPFEYGSSEALLMRETHHPSKSVDDRDERPPSYSREVSQSSQRSSVQCPPYNI
ncbi:hypothetical protein FB45DRAFT_1007724 [Roridomyces roridus]|uniref:Mid2 domain-containing protein n=1 Tax=Roridomyces roridus TaxID=1738132 RepID=A0AAD7BC55_9AGAR|nr:hypothetical protein FB45DRAFT_1007724 [Roridomyces roridus]